MKMLRILKAKDSHMWYSKLIGKTVPYIGQWPEAYKSREPAGYVNIVEFDDAEIIEIDSKFNEQ
jgi:hypothetical protein